MCSVRSTSMNSLPEPVLERDALALHPAGDQHDLLVLDVHAFDRPDPLRELEDLRLGERRGRVEATLALPDQRRVQALLDRGPDRERRREVVALDDEVGAVADADFADRSRTARRRRSGRTGPTGRARRRSPRAPADPPAPSARSAASCLSPSISPGSSYGRSGWGCESVIAMSRYVTRVSKAAAKICSLKRGSVAFSTASGPHSRDQLDDAGLVGGVHALGARNGRARRCGRPPPGRASSETSASTTSRNTGRRWAMPAKAAPTPPAPTTRTFIGRAVAGGAPRWLECCACCGHPRG